MRVFLGSSREADDNGMLLRVAGWVERYGHEPLRWNESGAFPLGTYTFSRLQELARGVDAAIFIFAEDDKVWYRSENSTQPRDNILLEYGVFSGVLGEDRVAICRSGSPRIATDLAGITYVNVTDLTKVRAETDIREWLRRIAGARYDVLPGGLLMERLNSPFQASGKPSLFEKGTELVQQARHRVALVAKTPIVLMGPRPYDGSGPSKSYEKRQYETYMNLVADSSAGRAPDFVCVASRPCVIEEMARFSHTPLREQVRDRYIELDKRSANVNAGSRMKFRWHGGSAPMTFLVSDDSFMIWFKDGSGESVWITALDENVAGALYSNALLISEDLSVQDVLHDIDQLSSQA